MLHHVPLTLRVLVVLLTTSVASSQDWPQWRGPQRDGRATGFDAPDNWPEELTKGWSVAIGDGVATPALVGDKLYTYARQDGDEVVRCQDAASGDTIWEDRSPADEIQGAAGGFPGPRSSPAVFDGKVVVLGVQGKLSCLNAANGEVLWRNTDLEGVVPRFATSSSPLVADGLCIAQLGEEGNGGVFAFDLDTGEQQWKWAGDGPCYGSPIAMTIGDTRALVMPTSRSMVALDTAGQLLWEMPYSQGRYNSATPIGDGQALIVAGPERGMSAFKLQQQGDMLAATEAWANPELSVRFNTPVLRDELLYGLSAQNALFCADAGTGEALWTAPLSGEAPPEAARPNQRQRRNDNQDRRQRRGRRRGRGRRGGGRGGYGSIVDAGAVMLTLTPDGSLVAFEPARDAFHELARYKVAERGTYAYPVVVDRRVFIKDQDSLTLWTVE